LRSTSPARTAARLSMIPTGSHFEKSLEPNDLLSKGFLSDEKSVAKLETTLMLGCIVRNSDK
jgi:hypothetical protein